MQDAHRTLLTIQGVGTIHIRHDQAFLTTTCGAALAYSHNHLAPGHKPFAWSLVDTIAFGAHCAAHGCQSHPPNYIRRTHAPFISDKTRVQVQLQVNEVVQTGGGGYRCERRDKTVEFVRDVFTPLGIE